MGARQTLCWGCEKSATEGCAWAKNFDPVEGWEAEESKNGYLVINCPEFVKEERRRRDLDTDGCMDLVEKVLETCREDYIMGGEKTEEKIERFLKGRGASRVHRISNPEAVIRKLKKDKEKYWEEHQNEQTDNHWKPYKRP